MGLPRTFSEAICKKYQLKCLLQWVKELLCSSNYNLTKWDFLRDNAQGKFSEGLIYAILWTKEKDIFFSKILFLIKYSGYILWVNSSSFTDMVFDIYLISIFPSHIHLPAAYVLLEFFISYFSSIVKIHGQCIKFWLSRSL